MLLEKERAKLENLKSENVDLQARFEKKSSLLVKISIFYLLLTLINLFIFWIVTGTNQFRLISDKAYHATSSTAFLWARRLNPIIQNKKWPILALKKKNQKAINRLTKALRIRPDTEKLLMGQFQLLLSNGDTLYNFPESKKVEALDQVTRQRVLKSLQMQELEGKAFYAVPSVLDYHVEIYMPLSNQGEKDIVFYSKIEMDSIKEELKVFIILALSMIGLMLLVQTLFGYVLYRMMVQPIKALAGGAESVGRGNLNFQLEVGKKTDEIGLLTFSFNNMVASLKEKTEKLEATIEELEKHNEIMQNELEMAQNIQSGIMPQDSLSERIRVGVYYGPLEKVSGDYYDIFPLPDGSVGILITDASGHGVPAALVTIMAKVHFSSLAEKYPTPGELFSEVNKELSKAITTSDYLTAFYLVIKPDLTVDYCNASHQKALIYRHKTGDIEELDTGGFFIGAIEEAPFPYETHNLTLEAKDRIILYTDGIVEGTNPKNEEYSNERFIDKIKEYSQMGVEEFNTAIMKDVDEFAAGEPRRDDYTLFTIEIADVEVSSQASDLFSKGEGYYQNHEFDRAKECFKELLGSDPGNLQAKLFLANSCFFLKQYEEAIPHFEEYTQIKTTNPYAFLKLGVCYAKTGNEEHAIEQYQKSIQINNDLAEAYGQLAISYANKGDFDLAKEQLEQALQRKPDDARLHKIRDKIESRSSEG